MKAALISSGSRHRLAAPKADADRADVEDAVTTLRADYERWSRWGLGVVAFLVASTGTFVAVGLIETVRMLGGTPTGIDLLIVIGAVVLALAGFATLGALWWSGRALLTALNRWTRFSYAGGGRDRLARGWVRARAINFEPRVFLRILTATLALLVAIGGIALFMRDMYAGITSMTTAVGAVGAVALLAGLGQAGGVMRLVTAVAEGDPLWARVRSAGSFGRGRL